MWPVNTTQHHILVSKVVEKLTGICFICQGSSAHSRTVPMVMEMKHDLSLVHRVCIKTMHTPRLHSALQTHIRPSPPGLIHLSSVHLTQKLSETSSSTAEGSASSVAPVRQTEDSITHKRCMKQASCLRLLVCPI